MIYAGSMGSSGRGKPSTGLPRMDPGAKEESYTTGTLRCRFREKFLFEFFVVGAPSRGVATPPPLPRSLTLTSQRTTSRTIVSDHHEEGPHDDKNRHHREHGRLATYRVSRTLPPEGPRSRRLGSDSKLRDVKSSTIIV